MKLGIPCWILILSSLVIFSGTAGAHPHELGKMDHGQPLENYMIELDFTKEDSTQGQHGPDTTLAKIDQSRSSSKIDKSVRTKKLDKAGKIKEGKDEKLERQKK